MEIKTKIEIEKKIRSLNCLSDISVAVAGRFVFVQATLTIFRCISK